MSTRTIEMLGYLGRHWKVGIQHESSPFMDDDGAFTFLLVLDEWEPHFERWRVVLTVSDADFDKAVESLFGKAGEMLAEQAKDSTDALDAYRATVARAGAGEVRP